MYDASYLGDQPSGQISNTSVSHVNWAPGKETIRQKLWKYKWLIILAILATFGQTLFNSSHRTHLPDI